MKMALSTKEKIDESIKEDLNGAMPIINAIELNTEDYIKIWITLLNLYSIISIIVMSNLMIDKLNNYIEEDNMTILKKIADDLYEKDTCKKDELIKQ